MSTKCNHRKCSICTYGNICSITIPNNPFEFLPASKDQIIQRLDEYQFSRYRQYMIQTLYQLGVEYTETDVFSRLRKYDLTSSDDGLDECPFCGGQAELYITKHIPTGYDFTPRCRKPNCCGRLTKKYPSRDLAVRHWNMRAPMTNDEYSNMITKVSSIYPINHDELFFSHLETAEKYARADPNEKGYKPIYKFSYPGQILLVRHDDGALGKYIIQPDRSLKLLENLPDDNYNDVYTKEQIDDILNPSGAPIAIGTANASSEYNIATGTAEKTRRYEYDIP